MTRANHEWLSARLRRIFTFAAWPSRLVTAAVVLLGLYTVQQLGPPFISPVPNVCAVVIFAVVLVMCGQGAYVCYQLAVALVDLTSRKATIPFLLHPHPSLAKLTSFYLAVALAVAVGYGLVAILAAFGPYGVQPILVVWLSALAFYPLSLFCLWFFRLQAMNQAIKFSFARSINAEVQKALHAVCTTEAPEAVTRLEKLVAVQTTVDKMRAWPLDIQSSLTLLVALLTAVGQVLLLTTQNWKQ